MSEEIVTPSDVAEAVDRIARTSDGAVLYRHLQKVLMGVLASNGDFSTFSRHEGRRMLASEIMGMMAPGIRTHARADAVVVFNLAGSGHAERRPAGSRRITRDTFVAGFDNPEFLAVPDDP